MATSAQSVSRGDSLGDLRQERDRFVALAFSASDVLFELDRDGCIVFTAGAAGALLGAQPGELLGRPFLDLVAPADRSLIREALAAACKGTRINGLACHLEGQFGKTPPLMLLGYQVPDLDGHFFLGLRLGAKDAALIAVPEHAAPTESGLADAHTFAELTGEKLAGLAADGEASLTMLRLDDLAALRQRLDDENRREMAAAIGGALRASAIGGELAGEIGDGSYGVVHRPDVDIEVLRRRIEEITRAADPDKRGLSVAQTTVALDPQTGGADEAVKALNYIFAKFAEAEPDGFAIKSLTEGLGAMVNDTGSRIAHFKDILRNGRFEIAFQPVVDLDTQRPHHFEALARFPHLPAGASPYDTITFAEQTGMIRDFDLAMCQRVVEWLQMAGRQGQRYKVAVNLSGTSIASKPFVMELHKLLRRHDGIAETLIFEITESAKIRDLDAVNATLQSLRRAGHKVCLDDFGAGAAAFQYLRDLEVDVVKIDGAYVRGALGNEKGMAFLRAMTGLCHDLGITTVAEMVEDHQSLQFLRDCGVGYGQGYLFGRPSLDIGAFDAPRPRTFAPPQKRGAGGV